MMTALTFTDAQRKDLLDEVTPAQVESLANDLSMLRHYAQPHPRTDDVQAAVAGFQSRAKADVKELESLLGGVMPAKAEAAGMLAFYLDRDPALGRAEFEPPWHPDAQQVLARRLADARQMMWAAEMVHIEVKGRRQKEVSTTAIAIIHGALRRAQQPGQPEIPVSYAAGAAFSKIVSICMAAAGGDDQQGYERWIRDYIEEEAARAALDDDALDGTEGPPLFRPAS